MQTNENKVKGSTDEEVKLGYHDVWLDNDENYFVYVEERVGGQLKTRDHEKTVIPRTVIDDAILNFLHSIRKPALAAC